MVLLPRLTLADAGTRQLERLVRAGNEGEWLRLAGFYDAVRVVYADGGALDDAALERVADLYDLDPGFARRLRLTARGDGVDVLRAAPTGRELLERAQAAVAAERASSGPAAALQAPTPQDLYGRDRKTRTGD